MNKVKVGLSWPDRYKVALTMEALMEKVRLEFLLDISFLESKQCLEEQRAR